MPWCDDCERFSNPNSLTESGGCPTCGAVIAEAPDPDADVAAPSAISAIPWHFWLLLVALVLYLGWRLVEGVVWLVGRF